MESINLIKNRISILKEKELTQGLTQDEKLEIGKLYITDEVNDAYIEKADSNLERYWKLRCLLTDRLLNVIPNSTNNTEEYKILLSEYNQFMSNFKEPEL